MDKNMINFELTEQQLEKEIKRVQHGHRKCAALRSTVFILLVIAAVTVLAATLWFPVLRITGNSMEPSLESGQTVLTLRTQELETGDIVAFYHDNRLLVRRVIAHSGDHVSLDAAGRVSVNEEILDEPYLENTVLEPNDLTYPYQVPDGCVFVMGDHRSASMDSRLSEIGCVSQDRIVGKVLFCILPFHQFEYLG